MSIDHRIGHLFIAAAERQPDAVLLRMVQSQLTYRQVAGIALSFAQRMRRLGVGPGSCVALDTQYHSVAIAGYVAISLLGAKWIQASRSALIETRLGITHVFHDGAKPYPEQLGVTRIDQTWSSPLTSEGVDAFAGQAGADEIWMYAQSSGTTGEPKLIPLNQNQVLHRARGIRSFAPAVPVVATAGPPVALPAISGFCRVFMGGGTLVIGGDYLFHQLNGVNVATGTPAQHVKRIEAAKPIPGRRIALASIGGAKSTPEFLKAMRLFYDNLAIGYGSTEAGQVCRRIVGAEDPNPEDLGPAIDGASVEIVGADDRPLPAGNEGIVRVRTPIMVKSYAFELAESGSSAFRDGWFYPGDMGRLSAAGGLTITGRTNDQLSMGGVKVNALLVDQVVQTVEPIKDAFAFTEVGVGGVPVLAVAAVVPDGVDKAAVATAVRNRCHSAIGRAVVPARIYFVGEVPRNERGKTLRTAGPDLVRNRPAY